MMLNMTVFGDSIMKGVECINNRYILSKERFAPQNADYHNMSKLGCTSDKGFEILKQDLPKLESGSVALLEYGGNDSDFNWDEVSDSPDSEHLPKVTVEQFEKTLNEMVTLLEGKGVKPVLMTLPPIDSYRYFDFIAKDRDPAALLKWLGRKEVIYSFQEQYSIAVIRTALKRKTKLVDVRSEFLKKRNFFPYISEDGIHPSSDGHKLIASTLDSFFESENKAG